MFVGVAIDPKKNNGCLTRRENGLFFWSERTMIKLTDSSGSGSIEKKQTKLVMCMIGLFLNLMMDTDENLSDGSLMDKFMEAFNLA